MDSVAPPLAKSYEPDSPLRGCRSSPLRVGLRLKPRKLTVPLALLLVVVLPPALRYLGALSGLWISLTGAAAIGVLADWVRRSTENLAAKTSPAVGGLLTVSFGSLAEVILAFFVLAAGMVDVLRAQITGSASVEVAVGNRACQGRAGA